ncbi:SGNH/GDSL hydrolase family protein [Streptomyces sp. CB03238]|uniref:SGNH/GDSL hydrolase family protein n=1 Tax=Streptomyces sp. CB03238 TaxID=1907777 RepID=UPI000A10C93E|nr:SGNH/GDSL hydrolase family protein [Streptomyces sp. CB03238]ORT57082.1 Inducer of phenazine A [Streptomyces sp. CB03238]
MTSQRAALTPQMLQYAEKFDDRGDIRWLPYLMYFHPAGHTSDVVRTDKIGFRLSEGQGQRASAGGEVPDGPVRLIAGSSTVFGIGASSDAHTLASRLWDKHAPSSPWLNFGGRSFNSAQELLLFTLYRHLVPSIDEIVLFTGFNNLGLARLPQHLQGDHGAFFNGHEYAEQVRAARLAKFRENGLSRRAAHKALAEPQTDHTPPSLDEQIDRATELTIRHLDNWRLLAAGLGAKLTFVLQPLAPWVREQPCSEESRLFAELDAIADFGRAYGDICTVDAGRRYARALSAGCERIGVPFLDMNPVLAEAADPGQWLFVDRIHFTDEGHDIVAGLLTDRLRLN